MKLLISDTNIWIDFWNIHQLELPFKLKVEYLFSQEVMDDELLYPKGLKEDLINCGIQTVEMEETEFLMAMSYNEKFVRPSVNDCIALAIAKNRSIPLLTGDGALRAAARAEQVEVHGSLWILDRLKAEGYINDSIDSECLQGWFKLNGGTVRLPEKELKKRLSSLTGEN